MEILEQKCIAAIGLNSDTKIFTGIFSGFFFIIKTQTSTTSFLLLEFHLVILINTTILTNFFRMLLVHLGLVI